MNNPDRYLIAEIRGPIRDMLFVPCRLCEQAMARRCYLLCDSCVKNRTAIDHMASALIRCIPALEFAAAQAERPVDVRAKENFTALTKLFDTPIP